MDRPWQAEHAVSVEQAREMIVTQLPFLAGAEVELLGFGWDNSVFVVGEEWVFRFPRRQIATQLLAAECTLLPAIAERLPLPIPVPTYLGEPCGDYPWRFAGYPMLPGRTACSADLDNDQRAAAAEPLASFLATLHSLPTAELRALNAPGDDLGRVNMRKRLPMVEQSLVKCSQLGLVGDDARLRRILADTPVDFNPGNDSLCHGDLYARHLLVDAGGALAGVIDWGDIHLGDPAVDLGIADSFLPPAAAERFFSHYRDHLGSDMDIGISVAQRRVARFRALHYALLLLIYGSDIGDDALVREGLTALRFLGDGAGS